MTELRVRTERTGTMSSVIPSGELDISTAGRVEAELRAVEAEEPGVIVLDLRELEFIDSTGLRVIIGADARARVDGRRLVLVEGPAHIQRVFRIALLDRRLEFVADPSEVEGSR